MNITKIALFFLSQATTHHSFIFNSGFLYELKHKIRLSKSVWGIFHFRFCFFFIKFFVFVWKKSWALWLQNVVIPLKIKIIEKPYTFFLQDLWFLSSSKKFRNSIISALVGACQKWLGDKFFKT